MDYDKDELKSAWLDLEDVKTLIVRNRASKLYKGIEVAQRVLSEKMREADEKEQRTND